MALAIFKVVFIFSVWCQIDVSASFLSRFTRSCFREPDKCIDQSKINCTGDEKYRTMDGSCNNPINPTLGMAFTTYRRLLKPRYADGVFSMPVASSGNPLPSARLLSYKVFGRHSIPDPDFTLLNMQWGQVVTHDTSIRVPEGFPGLKPLNATPQQCCSAEGKYEMQNISVPCLPISVPKGDQFFKDSKCIAFDRTITDKDQNCPGTEGPSPAEQISGVTHYLDLSFAYGNSKTQSENLRTLSSGLLKTSDNSEYWPPRSSEPQEECVLGDPNEACYIFGDARGNQHPGLTILQIVFLREHNRLARELAEMNPHWDDETLYQEARRINIAQFQYITYYEWNVNFYGLDRMMRKRLIYDTFPTEYVNDYDECVDPRSIQAFQHASFRYFHNQAMGLLQMVSETREVVNDTLQLTKLLDRPGILEQGCQFSSFVRGLSTQSAALTDKNFDLEMAENFIISGGVRSQELRTFDIQRDRDHGLASYNQYREYCGLKRARRWNDFADTISYKDIRLLRKLYESHEDVDLSIGGALERHLPDALVGPTFMCINLLQFSSLRKGDRYFFENANQPYPFTREQLAEIRKSSAARLLCDNGNVDSMQPFAFKKISSRNPLHPCSQIPGLDLEKWKDDYYH